MNRQWFRVYWVAADLEGSTIVEAKDPENAKKYVRMMYPKAKLKFSKIKVVK
jgi:hypothetical protein